MKKILALILAIAVVLPMSVVAMAGGGEDVSEVYYVLPADADLDTYWSNYEITKLEVGDTYQLAVYHGVFDEGWEYELYDGVVRWHSSDPCVSVSDTGLVRDVSAKKPYAFAYITIEIEGVEVIEGEIEMGQIYLEVYPKTTVPSPSGPSNPSVADSDSREDKAPEATQNAANDDKTTDALRKGEAVEVKVSNGSSALSTETANLLGGGSGKLTLQNGGMTVVLPGGFGKVTEAGRVYYPFDFEQNPARAAEILSGVKGDGAKSEAVKAGGVMTLPATATVTLRTKLTGTVNVYWYNEETSRYTLVASPTVTEDGTITFSTRQMGYFLLTTGRV